jgi:histidinol-phosphate aminotransferase
MSVPARRDDLVDLEGYHSVHVDVEVRLNTNESPFPPPPAFVAALQKALAEGALNRYPDRAALELRRAIARYESVSVDEIFCGSGSNEVLECLLLAFGGFKRTALVFEPTYALHGHISQITQTSLVSRQRGIDFVLNPTQVANDISEVQPSLTFLCSPNNPTGNAESNDVVRSALQAGDGLIVVDEAYGQFSSESAQELRAGENAERLVIVKTFSKTWALAGVRLGYAIGDPEVMAACEAVALPYHLSSLTQMAGILALSHVEEMDERVREITKERLRVSEAMSKLALRLWPSEANFILFKPLRRSGHDVWERLVQRSVLIRDCSSWSGLEDCLRVTIGTADENDRFLIALEEAL